VWEAMSHGIHSDYLSFRRAHLDRPEALAVRDDVRVRKKSSASMKAFEPMCPHRRSLAVQVDLDSHAVLVADVKHRSQESRWKLGFRGEAGVDLSSSGQDRALGRSSLVDALRLVCRTVSRPSSLVRALHVVHVSLLVPEKYPLCLSASAIREVSGLFGTSRDHPGFFGRHDHHEIRNRLYHGRD